MATKLNYDAQGFIVGIGRVEGNTKKIHDDTQEIVRILMAQRQVGNERLQDMNNTLEKIQTALNHLPANNAGKAKDYQSPSVARNKTKDRANKPTGNTRPQVQATTRDYGSNNAKSPSNRTHNTSSSQNAPRPSSGLNNPRNPHIPRPGDGESHSPVINDVPVRNTIRTPRNTDNRQRDAGGRFTAKAEDAKFVDKLAGKLGETFDKGMHFDDKNLDPLVDSFHEVKDALSPLSSVIGFINDRAEKRREKKHDREVEETLDDIAENTAGGNSGGGRGGGGLLGGLAGRALGGVAGMAGSALGMLGKGGKFLMRGGGKGLGILGTLIGAGSLAMDWGNLDHEGKSAGVGGLAGGMGGGALGAAIGTAVFPGVGTVVGGAIGAWLGSEGGEALGKTASPYIQSWTSSLQQYNLGDKLKTAFDFGMNPFFFGLTNLLPSLNDWVAKTTGIDVAKGFSNLWDDIKAKFGFGSASNPNAPINGGASGGVSGSDIVAGEGWSGGSNPFAGKKLTDAVIGGGVKGTVVGGGGNFGASRGHRSHTGQDIAVPIGTPIVAPEDGVFTMGKTEHGGNEAYLKTADGRRYGFAHLSDYAGLKPGQTVKAGTTIAKSGNTGIGSGPHLHLSYTDAKGNKIDPKKITIPNGGSSYAGGGGKFNGGGAGGSWGGASSGLKGNQQRAYNSARMNGLSDTAARALVANMSGESLSNPSDTTGDHGTAQGIVQWHPDRAKAIQKKFGKLPKDMSVEEQTSAAIWEMKTNPAYSPTWKALNSGGSAESMVGTLVKNYERPSDTNGQINKRVGILKGLNVSSASIPPLAIAASSKGMPVPTIASVAKNPIPALPKVTQRLDSGDKKQNIQATNQGGISQNVSDRGIAHAVTGGLGEDRYWG